MYVCVCVVQLLELATEEEKKVTCRKVSIFWVERTCLNQHKITRKNILSMEMKQRSQQKQLYIGKSQSNDFFSFGGESEMTIVLSMMWKRAA